MENFVVLWQKATIELPKNDNLQRELSGWLTKEDIGGDFSRLGSDCPRITVDSRDLEKVKKWLSAHGVEERLLP